MIWHAQLSTGHDDFSFTALEVCAATVSLCHVVCIMELSTPLEITWPTLIDYLFAQSCYKTAQVMATEHEQDSQAPSALIAALSLEHNFQKTVVRRVPVSKQYKR